MCLKFVEQEKTQRGIGYKVVRKIEEGLYKPYFTYFLKSCGGGTLVGYTEAPVSMRDRVTKTQVTYASNEFTRVRHKRIAHANNNQLYTAGIHLWLDEVYAAERLRALRILDDDPNLVLVKFRWSGPLARDADTIVASRAMPVSEITIEEELAA
jgi:hypothetical protein